MTKVAFRTGIPYFDRDDFLTPFDKMFDQMVESQFPDVVKSVVILWMNGLFEFIRNTNTSKTMIACSNLLLRIVNVYMDFMYI